MKVAWILINASHYHLARWRVFVQHSSMQPIMVEIANQDASFDALSATESCGVERVTLFPGKTWQQASGLKRCHAIKKKLDRLSPDVICINGWSMGGSIASLQWALENNCRVVLFSDSNRFDLRRRKILEWFKGRLVSLADSAFTAGTTGREYLVELGMSPEVVFVGYDVVDNAHFSPASNQLSGSSHPVLAPESPYFVAAARFEPKKNHVRLLQAFAKYRSMAGDQAWPLVLLGDGKLRAEIEAERDKLGLGESLVLPGFAGYGELPAWYQNAACFIHPSTTEQWGLVVNEAMASGLPVLVSERCGCAPDLVENGVNGFTFDPYDVESLASLMARMAGPDCDRAGMGRASLEIIDRWSPETFASGLEAAVQAALKGGGRKANWLDRAMLRALAHR